MGQSGLPPSSVLSQRHGGRHSFDRVPDGKGPSCSVLGLRSGWPTTAEASVLQPKVLEMATLACQRDVGEQHV